MTAATYRQIRDEALAAIRQARAALLAVHTQHRCPWRLNRILTELREELRAHREEWEAQ